MKISHPANVLKAKVPDLSAPPEHEISMLLSMDDAEVEGNAKMQAVGTWGRGRKGPTWWRCNPLLCRWCGHTWSSLLFLYLLPEYYNCCLISLELHFRFCSDSKQLLEDRYVRARGRSGKHLSNVSSSRCVRSQAIYSRAASVILGHQDTSRLTWTGGVELEQGKNTYQPYQSLWVTNHLSEDLFLFYILCSKF